MDKLTEKQSNVINFIVKYLETNGFQPSLREIATFLKCGVPNVYQHLHAIEKKGYIKIPESGSARAIMLNGYLFKVVHRGFENEK